MPRIFDNIALALLPALKETLRLTKRGDFCVGYFNLRGWKQIDTLVDEWSGGEHDCCRLLVGMQPAPQDELRSAFSLNNGSDGIDQQTVKRLQRSVAESFREQLTFGAPTNADEMALRRLSAQIKARKVVVKLFLRHHLHAKLYLLHRADPLNPSIGFVGSSNLTFAGLSKQGELNVDVLDHDACQKLQKWFDDRWHDRWCLDISDELAEIIDTSWARPDLIPPYHIYLKIAYHLSQEARAGLSEFRIPRDFGNRLFEFQTAAVKIAAHHLKKRGGVLIGDVVGLGKTLMASALAKLVEEDQPGASTLIICPKNLVKMWQSYVDDYGLRARVMSLSRVTRDLPNVPARFRTVLIDESHNLRNREGKRYRAIQEYVRTSDSRCILLSATPYNKTYNDLSAQLRLFIPEDQDLGIRPERKIREVGDEGVFQSQYQCAARTLAAFEKSEYADDWRDLMRLFLVRRTRSFIQANYAETDDATARKYLVHRDGEQELRSYFPVRKPLTIKYEINEANPADPYARLTDPKVVRAIDKLNLPRYGLGNYVATNSAQPPTLDEKRQLEGLSRAGKRLMGFCRTNLFKRLESGGVAFLLSVERHILRNFVFLHAIENDLPLPIGSQSAEFLDSGTSDEDAEANINLFETDAEPERNGADAPATEGGERLRTAKDYVARAGVVYNRYRRNYESRFKWIRPTLFIKQLEDDLRADASALLKILDRAGVWAIEHDAKFAALVDLLEHRHPHEKVLVFTQFADTVHFLTRALKARNLDALAGVTGNSSDPTELAWRFSPESNGKRALVQPSDELRALIATDILSEGQNLQDASIVVNYDLPWAIIRLIQRAGRVDRIGQKAEEILCYSFLPADGVERIINLRSRVVQRLRENAEVVGADEAFFEDEAPGFALFDLYNEKSGILDGDGDAEVDLASQAYQIWKNAIDQEPHLKKTIPDMPNVSYSTRSHTAASGAPEGVLVYMRTAEGTDSLAWIDGHGRSVTQSQLAILQAAACHPDTPALPRHEQHHALVEKGIVHLVQEERAIGGGLGRKTGARFRAYERLKIYAEMIKGTLFESQALLRAIDEIYRLPLKQAAVDTLNRQLKSGISDHALADLIIALRDEDRLCITDGSEAEQQEPQIICSLGLFNKPA